MCILGVVLLQGAQEPWFGKLEWIKMHYHERVGNQDAIYLFDFIEEAFRKCLERWSDLFWIHVLLNFSLVSLLWMVVVVVCVFVFNFFETRNPCIPVWSRTYYIDFHPPHASSMAATPAESTAISASNCGSTVTDPAARPDLYVPLDQPPN